MEVLPYWKVHDLLSTSQIVVTELSMEVEIYSPTHDTSERGIVFSEVSHEPGTSERMVDNLSISPFISSPSKVYDSFTTSMKFAIAQNLRGTVAWEPFPLQFV